MSVVVMTGRSREQTIGADAQRHRYVITRTAAMLGVFTSVFALSKFAQSSGITISLCVFKHLVGLPCPGCGVTTSIDALLRGRMHDALAASMAGPFVALFFIIELLLFAGATIRVIRDDAALRTIVIGDRALLAVLLGSWLLRLCANG